MNKNYEWFSYVFVIQKWYLSKYNQDWYDYPFVCHMGGILHTQNSKGDYEKVKWCIKATACVAHQRHWTML